VSHPGYVSLKLKQTEKSWKNSGFWTQVSGVT